MAARAQFRWYELATTDKAAAEAFYTSVVGWSAEDLGAWANNHVLFKTPKGPIAGMTRVPALEGSPRWNGYVAVPDVDAYAERVKVAGGTLRNFPANIPGVLRFVEVADPQGARFFIYRGFGPEDPPRGAPDEPGYIVWHELLASDAVEVFGFYRGVFGWNKKRVFKAPGGPYRAWTDGRGVDAGAMTNRPEGAMGLPWTYYFRVDGIEAGAARVAQAGGLVTVGPRQLPTGAWALQAADQQGARFGLISRRR